MPQDKKPLQDKEPPKLSVLVNKDGQIDLVFLRPEYRHWMKGLLNLGIDLNPTKDNMDFKEELKNAITISELPEGYKSSIEQNVVASDTGHKVTLKTTIKVNPDNRDDTIKKIKSFVEEAFPKRVIKVEMLIPKKLTNSPSVVMRANNETSVYTTTFIPSPYLGVLGSIGEENEEKYAAAELAAAELAAAELAAAELAAAAEPINSPLTAAQGDIIDDFARAMTEYHRLLKDKPPNADLIAKQRGIIRNHAAAFFNSKSVSKEVIAVMTPENPFVESPREFKQKLIALVDKKRSEISLLESELIGIDNAINFRDMSDEQLDRLVDTREKDRERLNQLRKELRELFAGVIKITGRSEAEKDVLIALAEIGSVSAGVFGSAVVAGLCAAGGTVAASLFSAGTAGIVGTIGGLIASIPTDIALMRHTAGASEFARNSILESALKELLDQCIKVIEAAPVQKAHATPAAPTIAATEPIAAHRFGKPTSALSAKSLMGTLFRSSTIPSPKGDLDSIIAEIVKLLPLKPDQDYTSMLKRFYTSKDDKELTKPDVQIRILLSMRSSVMLTLNNQIDHPAIKTINKNIDARLEQYASFLKGKLKYAKESPSTDSINIRTSVNALLEIFFIREKDESHQDTLKEVRAMFSDLMDTYTPEKAQTLRDKIEKEFEGQHVLRTFLRHALDVTVDTLELEKKFKIIDDLADKIPVLTDAVNKMKQDFYALSAKKNLNKISDHVQFLIEVRQKALSQKLAPGKELNAADINDLINRQIEELVTHKTSSINEKLLKASALVDGRSIQQSAADLMQALAALSVGSKEQASEFKKIQDMVKQFLPGYEGQVTTSIDELQAILDDGLKKNELPIFETSFEAALRTVITACIKTKELEQKITYKTEALKVAGIIDLIDRILGNDKIPGIIKEHAAKVTLTREFVTHFEDPVDYETTDGQIKKLIAMQEVLDAADITPAEKAATAAIINKKILPLIDKQIAEIVAAAEVYGLSKFIASILEKISNNNLKASVAGQLKSVYPGSSKVPTLDEQIDKILQTHKIVLGPSKIDMLDRKAMSDVMASELLNFLTQYSDPLAKKAASAVNTGTIKELTEVKQSILSLMDTLLKLQPIMSDTTYFEGIYKKIKEVMQQEGEAIRTEDLVAILNNDLVKISEEDTKTIESHEFPDYIELPLRAALKAAIKIKTLERNRPVDRAASLPTASTITTTTTDIAALEALILNIIKDQSLRTDQKIQNVLDLQKKVYRWDSPQAKTVNEIVMSNLRTLYSKQDEVIKQAVAKLASTDKSSPYFQAYVLAAKEAINIMFLSLATITPEKQKVLLSNVLATINKFGEETVDQEALIGDLKQLLKEVKASKSYFLTTDFEIYLQHAIDAWISTSEKVRQSFASTPIADRLEQLASTAQQLKYLELSLDRARFGMQHFFKDLKGKDKIGFDFSNMYTEFPNLSNQIPPNREGRKWKLTSAGEAGSMLTILPGATDKDLAEIHALLDTVLDGLSWYEKSGSQHNTNNFAMVATNPHKGVQDTIFLPEIKTLGAYGANEAADPIFLVLGENGLLRVLAGKRPTGENALPGGMNEATVKETCINELLEEVFGGSLFDGKSRNSNVADDLYSHNEELHNKLVDACITEFIKNEFTQDKPINPGLKQAIENILKDKDNIADKFAKISSLLAQTEWGIKSDVQSHLLIRLKCTLYEHLLPDLYKEFVDFVTGKLKTADKVINQSDPRNTKLAWMVTTPVSGLVTDQELKALIAKCGLAMIEGDDLVGPEFMEIEKLVSLGYSDHPTLVLNAIARELKADPELLNKNPKIKEQLAKIEQIIKNKNEYIEQGIHEKITALLEFERESAFDSRANPSEDLKAIMDDVKAGIKPVNDIQASMDLLGHSNRHLFGKAVVNIQEQNKDLTSEFSKLFKNKTPAKLQQAAVQIQLLNGMLNILPKRDLTINDSVRKIVRETSIAIIANQQAAASETMRKVNGILQSDSITAFAIQTAAYKESLHDLVDLLQALQEIKLYFASDYNFSGKTMPTNKLAIFAKYLQEQMNKIDMEDPAEFKKAVDAKITELGLEAFYGEYSIKQGITRAMTAAIDASLNAVKLKARIQKEYPDLSLVLMMQNFVDQLPDAYKTEFSNQLSAIRQLAEATEPKLSELEISGRLLKCAAVIYFRMNNDYTNALTAPQKEQIKGLYQKVLSRNALNCNAIIEKFTKSTPEVSKANYSVLITQREQMFKAIKNFLDTTFNERLLFSSATYYGNASGPIQILQKIASKFPAIDSESLSDIELQIRQITLETSTRVDDINVNKVLLNALTALKEQISLDPKIKTFEDNNPRIDSGVIKPSLEYIAYLSKKAEVAYMQLATTGKALDALEAAKAAEFNLSQAIYAYETKRDKTKPKEAALQKAEDIINNFNAFGEADSEKGLSPFRRVESQIDRLKESMRGDGLTTISEANLDKANKTLDDLVFYLQSVSKTLKQIETRDTTGVNAFIITLDEYLDPKYIFDSNTIFNLQRKLESLRRMEVNESQKQFKEYCINAFEGAIAYFKLKEKVQKAQPDITLIELMQRFVGNVPDTYNTYITRLDELMTTLATSKEHKAPKVEISARLFALATDIDSKVKKDKDVSYTLKAKFNHIYSQIILRNIEPHIYALTDVDTPAISTNNYSAMIHKRAQMLADLKTVIEAIDKLPYIHDSLELASRFLNTVVDDISAYAMDKNIDELAQLAKDINAAEIDASLKKTINLVLKSVSAQFALEKQLKEFEAKNPRIIADVITPSLEYIKHLTDRAVAVASKNPPFDNATLTQITVAEFNLKQALQAYEKRHPHEEKEERIIQNATQAAHTLDEQLEAISDVESATEEIRNDLTRPFVPTANYKTEIIQKTRTNIYDHSKTLLTSLIVAHEHMSEFKYDVLMKVLVGSPESTELNTINFENPLTNTALAPDKIDGIIKEYKLSERLTGKDFAQEPFREGLLALLKAVKQLHSLDAQMRLKTQHDSSRVIRHVSTATMIRAAKAAVAAAKTTGTAAQAPATQTTVVVPPIRQQATSKASTSTSWPSFRRMVAWLSTSRAAAQNPSPVDTAPVVTTTQKPLSQQQLVVIPAAPPKELTMNATPKTLQEILTTTGYNYPTTLPDFLAAMKHMGEHLSEKGIDHVQVTLPTASSWQRVFSSSSKQNTTDLNVGGEELFKVAKGEGNTFGIEHHAYTQDAWEWQLHLMQNSTHKYCDFTLEHGSPVTPKKANDFILALVNVSNGDIKNNKLEFDFRDNETAFTILDALKVDAALCEHFGIKFNGDKVEAMPHAQGPNARVFVDRNFITGYNKQVEEKARNNRLTPGS